MGWNAAVDFETKVANSNADVAAMNYVTTPTIRGALKTREKAANTAQFICVDNQVNGYGVLVTSQITAGRIVFGDFSQLIVGGFGGLDITVDPYTASNAGTVRIVALQSIDIGVRQGAAFAAATDFS